LSIIAEGGVIHFVPISTYYFDNLVRDSPMKVNVMSSATREADWILLKYSGFEFMQKLMDDMTGPEPEKRPVIEEVSGYRAVWQHS
jgi:hypothetical protein